MNQENDRAVQMLQAALNMEEKGQKFYEEAVQKTQNQLGRDIFRMLMEDELVHMQRIKTIYQTLTEGTGWSESWKLLDVDVHQDLGQVFRQLAAEHGKNIKAETGDLQALDVGLDFELKSVNFYREQQPQATGELEKEFIEHMIAEEQEHHRLLDDMKFYLTDPDGWFMEKGSGLLDGA